MDYCKWQEDVEGIWETDCKNSFVFSDGGPLENEFGFCPYCGKKILSIMFVDPLDCEEEEG